MASKLPYALLLVNVGCFNPSKGEAPACFADTWAGASGFNFAEENFGCDTTPIEGDFLLDLSSILAPVGITSNNNIEAAFELSITEWNFQSSNLEIRYNNGSVSGGKNKADNVHHVFMTPGFDPQVPGTFAQTRRHMVSSNPNWASDCDIELFTEQITTPGAPTGVANPWTDMEPPGATEMSLAATLRHELGHCVGFLENSVPNSVMNYTSFGIGLAMPSLSVDDSDAVLRIYGL